MDNPTRNQVIAGRVAQAMENAGENKLSLAVATGIPRTTLHRRLTGYSSFTVNELAAIAAHLGQPIEAFLSEPAGIGR